MKIEEKKIDRLLICSYIIIGLLVANTIVLFLSNVKITVDKDEKNNTQTTQTAKESETNSDYDVSMMNSVDLDEVLKLFKSEKTQVIYLGRSTCGYCVQFLPTLQKAQKEYGYTTNYLDITTVSDASKLIEKDNDEKFLEENYGSTPMVILVKDGKMVDTWVGYSEYDDFAQFLEKNGFEK